MDSRPFDQNGNSVATGMDGNGVQRPFLLDPATGYLKCLIYTGTLTFSPPQQVLTDENNKYTAFGVDENGNLKPILINPSNNAIKSIIV